MNVTQYFGRIPLLPTRKGAGQRLLGRAFQRIRGDSDVLGIVLTGDGWDFVPGNIQTEGDEQWIIPTDGSKPYPADGVEKNPQRLLGCPIAVGYRGFGSLNEITNLRIARDVIIDRTSDGVDDVDDLADEDDEEADESEWDDFKEYIPEAVRSRLPDDFSEWSTDKMLVWGWKWLQGGADALVLEQDGDSAWVLERADYQTGDGPEWYRTRGGGYRFDARGAGAPPTDTPAGSLSTSYGPVPKLLAPTLCRLARNMHEGKIETGNEERGGTYEIGQSGTPRAIADGGQIEGAPSAKKIEPRPGDIQVEERAFVSPEDVKLLGGAQETQDKIQTLLKQTEAKENLPGDGLGSEILKYGQLILALILGYWMGGGTGSGDGGGGSMGDISPMMLEVLISVI